MLGDIGTKTGHKDVTSMARRKLCIEKNEVSKMAKGIVGAWLMLAFLIIPATWRRRHHRFVT